MWTVHQAVQGRVYYMQCRRGVVDARVTGRLERSDAEGRGST